MSQLSMLSSVLVATLTALVFSTSSILAANSNMSRIPAPASDETPKPEAAREVAILAGGCFWGVQGVFQHVKGVTSAVSGCWRECSFGSVRNGEYRHHRSRGISSGHL